VTKSMIVPLESSRLLQYAVPIPCYVCHTDNTYDAEFCTHCWAPMALAHQANTQKLRPRMVAAVGPSASGKTVYLGMLMDMLSRQPDRTQMLARGAFSITLQQTTISALARGEFPAKTPNEPDHWNWVHCQIRQVKRRRTIELIMPDMAGEAVMQEVEHPHTYRVVRSFLQSCTGALVFIDAQRLSAGRLDEDYFTMKLLSYLGELKCENGNRDWQQRPVALVLTKADQCEGSFDDPAGYAKARASGLWQQCRERFPRHRFFATGVAGACAWRNTGDGAKIQVPLRIEPRGILDPFYWLLDQLYP